MSILNENQIEKFLPILEDIIAILKKRDKITEKQIKLFLKNLELPEEVFLKEAEKWADLLLDYKNSDDEDEKDAIEIICLKRGIPKASLTISFSELKNNVFVEESSDLRISNIHKDLSISVKTLNFGQIEIGEKKRISFFVEGGPGSIENEIQYLKLSKTNFQIEKEEITAEISGGNEGEQIADSIYFRTNNEVKEVMVLADWKEKKTQDKIDPVTQKTISKEKGSKNNIEKLKEEKKNVPSVKSNKKDEFLNTGIYLMELGEFDKAIKELNQQISIDSKNFQAYNFLGIAYSAMGKNTQAISQYKKAISINKDDPLIFYNLGLSYFECKKFDQSIKQFQKVVSIEPKNAEAYNYMGLAYYKQLNYDQAINEYKNAISINPKNATYYNNLGKAYFFQEENEKAIKQYKKAISINPKDPITFNNLGDVYFIQKEYKKAIKQYKRSLEFDPDNEEYLDSLNDSYNKLNNPGLFASIKKFLRG